MMRNTIMTEKIARRGVRVPSEYAADFLDQIGTGKACTREVVSLRIDDRLGDIRHWLNSGRIEAQHQGYPVLDGDGRVRGVLTRRDLLDVRLTDMHRIGDMLRRAPIVVREDHSLREAADHMVAENVGRLIVVAAQAPHAMVGILTRGDLLAAHARRLREAHDAARHIRVGRRPPG
jgi:predicted transcriptional regulator